MISQFCNQNHKKWDDLLPELSLAVNSSKQASTGFSPAYLTQGRELSLPSTLFGDKTQGLQEHQQVSPHDRAAQLKDILKIVQYNLQLASNAQSKHYNLRRRNWSPKIGDIVVVKHHQLLKAVDNFAAKLAPKI